MEPLPKQYRTMVNSMNSSKEPTTDLAKQVVELFEPIYHRVNAIEPQALLQLVRENHLPMLKHFLYFESYAWKLFVIEDSHEKPHKFFNDQLTEFLYCSGELLQYYKSDFKPREEDIKQRPFIAAIQIIAHILKDEFDRFFIRLDPDSTKQNETWTESRAKDTSTAIFDEGEGWYSVTAHGVRFITDLTHDQVPFVFGVASDVLGYKAYQYEGAPEIQDEDEDEDEDEVEQVSPAKRPNRGRGRGCRTRGGGRGGRVEGEQNEDASTSTRSNRGRGSRGSRGGRGRGGPTNRNGTRYNRTIEFLRRRILGCNDRTDESRDLKPVCDLIRDYALIHVQQFRANGADIRDLEHAKNELLRHCKYIGDN